MLLVKQCSFLQITEARARKVKPYTWPNLCREQLGCRGARGSSEVQDTLGFQRTSPLGKPLMVMQTLWGFNEMKHKMPRLGNRGINLGWQ